MQGYLGTPCGGQRRGGTKTATFVFLQELCGVLQNLIVLLQLQHALAVIQHERDDKPLQVGMDLVARLLLRKETTSG